MFILFIIMFIKRNYVLEKDKLIVSQIQLVTFNEGFTWKSLHTLLIQVIAPHLNSPDSDVNQLVPCVLNKIFEMDTAVLHLLPVRIPKIMLPLTQSHHNKSDDHLAKTAGWWLHSIRSVIQLKSDLSLKTMPVEVGFLKKWLEELQLREQKFKNEEVVEGMAAYNRSEKKHTFEGQSLLIDVLTKVEDYNAFLKSFPINNLLIASDLEHIQSAVIEMFEYLIKEISRKTYPNDRARQLVAAISRDVNSKSLVWLFLPFF